MAAHTSGSGFTENLVLGVSPFTVPDARLVSAVCRAGGVGILDLGVGDRHSREALDLLLSWAGGPFGVRVTGACALQPGDLPRGQVHTVLLGHDAKWSVPELASQHRVLVEVSSKAEALRAVEQGAHGIVARGNEAGGPVGELSSFVLLQQLVDVVDLPVWVWGGVGVRTAAAAVVGGAAGVVLDSQLALLPESDLDDEIAVAIRPMDGSETTIVDGARLLVRRGAGQARILVGQDGFLAARFADEYGSVDRVVRAVKDSVVAALEQEPAAPSLIAQGPMTRVSDRAGFAASVAENGGLPFVALALATKEQTRALLRETMDLLGDRPWGAGILGFAAEEIRAGQLEVIEELRPRYAIIAGGRPAQAAALERLGITTFLHVPSPGLLKQFLDAGARRFIFEGSECGGHVGPRSSFPLWEAQLGVLLDFLGANPDAEVDVLFAGGIHDERSAAMVSALAAPLRTYRGTVGVLMGTAYLFTEEAVRDGAVRPLFQRQVIDAEATALLETAPGHSTRCVTSPFAEEFLARRDDLRGRGVPDREVWEELEQLNIGRLRIASKGVERNGSELLDVDEDRQLAEGMFMAGQVAVLRDAVTTVAALHESVSSGAVRYHAARAQALGIGGDVAEEPEPEPLDVAIIGMACMFPQAPDLPTFWANVLAGVDAVTEVPPERWDTDVYYSAAGAADRTPSKWGGFLPEIPFDPLRYGIPPASLASIEPVQLLALEAAYRSLVHAGYGDRPFDRARTSVVFGAESGSDMASATTLRTVLPSYLGTLPEELERQLPRLTEDTFPGVLANVIAGRIANRLDLGGANYTVDAACASSMAAVDVACKELVTGTSDMVLCGAADLHNGINDYLMFSSVGALSPSGRCKTFDSSADGTTLGEGVACVVLKRLADAERDGDKIYAVIKGIGSASDGKSLGLTAPRPEGQRSAVERAYRNAGISPAEVGLVEAHGTGTVVGDRTELGTLAKVFTEHGARPRSCAIGSVKSQIGHTKCAAGLAGLIKTTLALHNGIKPPTLHVTQPNSAWDVEGNPFALHAEAAPWAAPATERIAAVSAFGFGGTNFHIVLAAYDKAPTPRHSNDQWAAELFTFRGADHASAARSVEWLLELVAKNEAHGRTWRLRDLARTASRRAEQRSEPTQIAVVARSLDELPQLLRAGASGQHDPKRGVFVAQRDIGGKVAFLFPGQGSQRPGMLAELFVAFPEIQHLLHLGRDWADALFPPAAFDQDTERQHKAGITDTRAAQPTLGIAGLAVNQLLTRLGVKPDLLAGHSYGELVALSAAGSFGPATLLSLSRARADSILAAAGEDPGAMAAITASAEDIASVLTDELVLANHNTPKQAVISGPTEQVRRAVETLRATGVSGRQIPVACAFHSPLVAGAGKTFGEYLSTQDIREPELPVWSNRTATAYNGDVREELAAQIGSPVRFVDEIESMYEAGARVFVEVGPGKVLTRLVEAILGDRPHVRVTTDGGVHGFLTAAAQLAVSGANVRTSWLFHGRDALDVSTATPPKRPGWTIDGQLVRTADGQYLAGGLTPARRVELSMFQPSAGQDALISEYLRTSREMVAAQRDVLLAYFGGTANAPARIVEHVAPPVVEIPQAVAAPTPIAEPEPVATADVLTTVLDVISQQTGYPTDMIDPTLDLEADLSIDSIKRTEIAGTLVTRLGAAATSDVEELTKARTAQQIADLFGGGESVATAEPIAAEADGASSGFSGTLVGVDAGDASITAAAVASAAGAVTVGGAAVVGGGGRAPRRFEMIPTEVGAARQLEPTILSGKEFRIIGGQPELVNEVTAALGEHEASVTDNADNLLYLGALSPSDDPVLPGAFTEFKAALARGPQWVVAVSPVAEQADDRVVGLRGFFRTISREYPETVAKLIEVDAAAVIDGLLTELLADDRHPVVVRGEGSRRTIDMVPVELGSLGTTGAGPAGDGTAEAQAIGLDRDSVVLLVGGARGITAQFATKLAATSGCRIELIGRTQLPAEPEDPATVGAKDKAALRAALIARGHRSPAEIERMSAKILAAREVRATLDELRALGSTVGYHSADVRDQEVLHRIVKEIYTDHGRIDGVCYAAGVIEDKLIADKDADSFRRVFDTKVDGARALLSAIEELPAPPRFVTLFGSIAAALGNRGQIDYSAANDALQTLGALWAARTGNRALTVHWGPWVPDPRHGGMVTPDLQQEYGRRGIELIDPEEGTMALLRELAFGDHNTRAVVYTASGW
ncbi:type I polyketide synthase [Kutzneria kofuensis]|uniref:Acyl transferase domain-containing protein/NAD(P)H-dependent flavin oxidoreductase YrpB (Nitropropane dioxygenase family) n=1 Tax=Kutzneria kofuensis TaxID=103725 RepID=A0A7W9NHW6_9PSEU|nr:type I polyketide synthase [Kutzneria kofuensis]MBB5893004.1 acyl transferase domain-containing protein/NAD(P)H-dependent flavin oxidoreductase YrpB (nitropropane dioxygenase family) [Kutzneria kofuensis]